MSSGKEFWSPTQVRREPEPLEQRLRSLETAIGRLHDQQRAISDPITGEVLADDGGALGGGSGGGDGGGGGGGPIVAHEVFNNSYHNDAETLTPVSQDVPVVNASGRLALLAVGASGLVLKVVAGVVAWAAATFTVKEANVSVATDITTLDFGSGFDLSASGGEAEIGLDLSEVANSGDLTFSTNTPTVAKIQGAAVADPVAGDDGQFLRYNSSGDTATWETPSTPTPTITVQEGDSTVDAAVTTLDFAAADFNVTSSPAGEANIAWQGLTVEEGNVAVATDIKDIDFGAGFDVSASGGEAEVGLDLSEVVTGDLTLATNAATVAKVQGVPVTAPVAGNDGEALVYNHAGPNFEYASIAGGGATIVVQEGDSTVDAAAGTLDFAASDFNVTSSPAGEANIAWQGFTVEEGNVSVATDVKDLDFGAGFDVSASGGEAEIGLDLSEVVTGDVTFVTNAATVTGIQGQAVPDPTSAEDEKALVYDHGTTAWVYRTRIVQYSLWRRADISTVGIGGEVPMFDGVNTGIRMPAAGTVVGVSVILSGDVGGVGDSYGMQVRKATSDGGAYSAFAPSISVTITGGTGTERSASDLTGAGAFNSGDILTLYDSETGAAAVAALGSIYVVFDA